MRASLNVLVFSRWSIAGIDRGLKNREENLTANCKHPLYWHGMYKGNYDLIAPDSFAHPAKMAPALCYKILQHLQELGLLKEGDTILDPMAGTGMTNICAGAMGYPSISVELEEKFVDFQQQNKEYAERRLYKGIDWQMIHGDSRKLSELLQGQDLKSITSPPYEDSHIADNQRYLSGGKTGDENKAIARDKENPERYGYSKNPENIGNLKDTPLKAITSPPYGETGVGDWKTGRGEFQDWVINELKTKGYVEWKGKRYNEAEWRALNHGRIDGRTTKGVHKHPTDGYSEDPANLGNLKDIPLKAITSPPYGDTGISGGDLEARLKRLEDAGYSDIARQYREGNPKARNFVLKDYGEAEGQIGRLSDKPLKSIMSPPYDNRLRNEDRELHGGILAREFAKGNQKMVDSYSYGKNEENIGNKINESYLSAMLQVYQEIALVSDVLVVVVKNPTRNGKLRRLDLDTIRIMEMAGWKIHCQHRALLFEELEQADLFGEAKKQVKGRLSFFKRLSWQKGQPVASWEDVIIGVRGVRQRVEKR